MFQKSGFCIPTQSATKSYYTHNLPIAKVFNLYGQKIIFASSHWPVSNETKFMLTTYLYFNFFEHKPRQILKWGLIFHTIQNNVIHISNLMQLLLLQNNMHFLIYLVSFFQSYNNTSLFDIYVILHLEKNSRTMDTYILITYIAVVHFLNLCNRLW